MMDFLALKNHPDCISYIRQDIHKQYYDRPEELLGTWLVIVVRTDMYHGIFYLVDESTSEYLERTVVLHKAPEGMINHRDGISRWVNLAMKLLTPSLKQRSV